MNTKQDKYQKPTGTHFILKLQVTKDKEKKLKSEEEIIHGSVIHERYHQ